MPVNPSLCLEPFDDLTPEQARAATSESGYGVTLDGLHAYWPGIPCYECGKFVGRDGHIGVEHFEMSSEIASVEGLCRGVRRRWLKRNGTTLDDRFTRLRSWSLDEAHLIQSVRYQEPQYRNPSELRADVRELIARYDALVLLRERTEGRSE